MAVKQYIAMKFLSGYSETAYGPESLESLRESIEDGDDDVDDFCFYEVAKEVNVKLEKKLTLVEA